MKTAQYGISYTIQKYVLFDHMKVVTKLQSYHIFKVGIKYCILGETVHWYICKLKAFICFLKSLTLIFTDLPHTKYVL